MPRALHVFSGPTLDAVEVRRAVPEAVVHPPVAAGDLARLHAGPGDVVVLVDGAMTDGNAVRHKEILALVEAGVDVWGTGALGALRAAELHDHGVRPYGRVARLLVRGVLEGDDEVAAGAAADAVTLVDVRATCRAACRAGVVDEAAARRLVAAAQSLPPQRRRHAAIAGAAAEAGLDEAASHAYAAFAAEHAVRLTRDDALDCLLTVRRRLAQPPRPRRTPRAVLTSFAEAWREEAAGAELPGGFVGDLAVLAFCRLLAVDFPAFQRRVALRTLAALSSPEASSGQREGQALVREFAAAHGLDVDSLSLWLLQRGMRREELLAHLRREQAVALLLQALDVDPADERAADATLAELVGEHARRRGFVAPGPLQGWERSWLSAAELESLAPGERIARLAARSFHSMPGMGWRQPLLQDLKVSGVFRVAREGVVQAREHLLQHAGEPAAPDEAVVAWFVERWNARDRFDLALLDRGFSGIETFLPRARPFHAFDRDTTTYRDLRCLAQSTALTSF